MLTLSDNRKGTVICDACEHFTPDKIGSGAGIGVCGLGIKLTYDNKEMIPLFRYAKRYCKDFSRLMS